MEQLDGINSFSPSWGGIRGEERRIRPRGGIGLVSLSLDERLPFIGHVLIDACLSDSRAVGGPSVERNRIVGPCHSSNENERGEERGGGI